MLESLSLFWKQTKHRQSKEHLKKQHMQLQEKERDKNF